MPAQALQEINGLPQGESQSNEVVDASSTPAPGQTARAVEHVHSVFDNITPRQLTGPTVEEIARNKLLSQPERQHAIESRRRELQEWGYDDKVVNERIALEFPENPVIDKNVLIELAKLDPQNRIERIKMLGLNPEDILKMLKSEGLISSDGQKPSVSTSLEQQGRRAQRYQELRKKGESHEAATLTVNQEFPPVIDNAMYHALSRMDPKERAKVLEQMGIKESDLGRFGYGHDRLEDRLGPISGAAYGFLMAAFHLLFNFQQYVS